MDFLRPRLARHVLAVTTIGIGLAGLGGACAAQDERGAMSQAAYHGPYLSWSGKKAQAPAPDPDLAEARYAPAPNYDPGAAAPQAQRYAAPQAPRYAAPQAQHYAEPVSDGPESRYGPAPRDAQLDPRHSATQAAEAYSSPAAYAPPAPQAAPPAPVQPPAAAPAPQPAAAYAAPSSAAPPAAQAEGPRSVRFYSLHREYGMTPDPIPQSSGDHTVLIGPPDNGPAAHDPDQDSDQDQGGAGDDKKAAAHGDGAGDKQSGDN